MVLHGASIDIVACSFVAVVALANWDGLDLALMLIQLLWLWFLAVVPYQVYIASAPSPDLPSPELPNESNAGHYGPGHPLVPDTELGADAVGRARDFDHSFSASEAPAAVSLGRAATTGSRPEQQASDSSKTTAHPGEEDIHDGPGRPLTPDSELGADAVRRTRDFEQAFAASLSPDAASLGRPTTTGPLPQQQAGDTFKATAHPGEEGRHDVRYQPHGVKTAPEAPDEAPNDVHAAVRRSRRKLERMHQVYRALFLLTPAFAAFVADRIHAAHPTGRLTSNLSPTLIFMVSLLRVVATTSRGAAEYADTLQRYIHSPREQLEELRRVQEELRADLEHCQQRFAEQRDDVDALKRHFQTSVSTISHTNDSVTRQELERLRAIADLEQRLEKMEHALRRSTQAHTQVRGPVTLVSLATGWAVHTVNSIASACLSRLPLIGPSTPKASQHKHKHEHQEHNQHEHSQ
eukprot:m.482303 g.482303  ORF g.482303 m.482303 type:complete len:464 (-) comp22490_c0_seq1:25-1416(-)